MAFNPGTGIIGTKLRQEMYLKHLREVEKINNRQSDKARKSLKQYRSITQIHKQNKIKAYKFRVSEEKRKIEGKNKEIFKKIMSLQSENDMSHKQNYRYWQAGGQTSRTDLHYQYRKKQQQKINNQNKQLMTAIIKQKSTILPEIPKNKCEKANRSRVSVNQTNIV